MADTLTGSRIRERRQIRGLRQADLARMIGISASYLNLIEHNRRRIGGKLLNTLAGALDVDPGDLTEGAEATLIAALRDAEARMPNAGAETDRIEDFTARFPGWARVLSDLYRRNLQLEHVVEGLNDRLTHDPNLAESVHEVLTAAASIRSTASILAETDSLEAEWLSRFHANVYEDSKRLAESSRALAQYLEAGPGRADGMVELPQEEADRFFAAQRYSFEALETGGDGQPAATPDALIAQAALSRDAQDIVGTVLEIYCADAAHLPLAGLRDYLSRHDPATEPLQIARDLGLPVGLVLRRLSCLPELETGYVLCDRSGAVIWRKPILGFDMPRLGATSPDWPLFDAMSQPGAVLRVPLEQQKRQRAPFIAYAVTETEAPQGYNRTALNRAGMLLCPDTTAGRSTAS